MKNKILLTSAAVLFLTAHGAFASSEVEPEQDTSEATASLPTAIVDERVEATIEPPTAPLEEATEEQEEEKTASVASDSEDLTTEDEQASIVTKDTENSEFDSHWFRNLTYFNLAVSSYELFYGKDILWNAGVVAMTWYSRPPKELMEYLNEKVVSPIKTRLAESGKKKKKA